MGNTSTPYSELRQILLFRRSSLSEYRPEHDLKGRSQMKAAGPGFIGTCRISFEILVSPGELEFPTR